MTHSETITYIMELFVEEYGSAKFRVSDNRVKLWNKLLEGFDSETVLAAATHVLSMGNEWPPPIGVIRETCLDFSYGELMPESAEEAWLHVYEYCTENDKVSLTQLQRFALKAVGGSWSVRNASSQSVIQAQFCKAYEQAHRRQRVNRLALPNVKQLVDKRALKLLEGVMASEFPLLRGVNCKDEK